MPLSSLEVTKSTAPEALLELPKGRLMMGELVADFSPENVVDAAGCVIRHLEMEFSRETFVTQARVIAYAANHTSWNNRPEYKSI